MNAGMPVQGTDGEPSWRRRLRDLKADTLAVALAAMRVFGGAGDGV